MVRAIFTLYSPHPFGFSLFYGDDDAHFISAIEVEEVEEEEEEEEA